MAKGEGILVGFTRYVESVRFSTFTATMESIEKNQISGKIHRNTKRPDEEKTKPSNNEYRKNELVPCRRRSRPREPIVADLVENIL